MILEWLELKIFHAVRLKIGYIRTFFSAKFSGNLQISKCHQMSRKYWMEIEHDTIILYEVYILSIHMKTLNWLPTQFQNGNIVWYSLKPDIWWQRAESAKIGFGYIFCLYLYFEIRQQNSNGNGNFQKCWKQGICIRH